MMLPSPTPFWSLKLYPFRRIPRTKYHPPPPQTSMLRHLSTILTSTTPLIFIILVLLFFLSHSSAPPPAQVITPTPSPYLNPRGILMSCPPGPAHSNRGPWKPSKMTLGVEGVLRQSVRYNTTLPIFLAYYAREEPLIVPWCQYLINKFGTRVNITCFKIPEEYPKGLYGYAKVFAIRHVPVRNVLWLDCDVFPVRRLDDLFDDPEFAKTGAMFWADSRDFFDETKLHSVLSYYARKTFPKSAWYVRQGFDSGLVLLDKRKCHEQIEELSRIARSPKAKYLRSLSMGDKDMFHIVWMRHNKNFTLVPYIGETGSLQGRRKTRMKEPRVGRVHWVMSSQVKHGRDGLVCALHQLHRQHPRSVIATLSKHMPYFTSRVTMSTTHVKPFLNVRLDLRLIKPGHKPKPKVGEFVGGIEEALISSSGMAKNVSLEKGAITKKYGLRVEWTPSWIHAAAAEMGRVWKHGVDAESAARAIYRDHRKLLLMKRVSGGYRKLIYQRLWNGDVKRDERRRRNVIKWKKRDEGRAIRKIAQGPEER